MDINQPSEHADTGGQCPGDSAGLVADRAPQDVPSPPKLREPRTATVWEMECELRRAKAAQLEWIHRFHNDYVAETLEPFVADYESAKAREARPKQLQYLKRVIFYAGQEAGRAAIMFLAEALNRSEFVVTGEYYAVQRAKESLPQTWQAFTQGRICDFRLRKITAAAEQLCTQEAIDQLDDKAPAIAETTRIGELNKWLKEFTHTVEPSHASERFAQAARARRVTVADIEDGMSLLTAVIPTLTAKAIQRRLEALTRSPVHPVPHNPLIAEHTFELQQQEAFQRTLPAPSPDYGVLTSVPELPEGFAEGQGRSIADDCPAGGFSIEELPTTRETGDPRNLDQRAADAFCAWMLNAETPEGIEIDAQIGIIVHEETLTGASTRPAITRDGSTCIPARSIQDLLAYQIGRLEWYQLLHSKDDDLLAIKSSGRYPPPRLRAALWFRDKTCTADGCTVPAERCDADHIQPQETGGSTTADNLQLLCRRHHRLKSWSYPIRAA